MGVGIGTYGVCWRQRTEVASPPSDWLVSLAEFNFGTIYDYDVDVVRGSGFTSQKATTSVMIQSPVVSTDGIAEIRILIRRSLQFWKDIA
jgi:hypothetical protein